MYRAERVSAQRSAGFSGEVRSLRLLAGEIGGLGSAAARARASSGVRQCSVEAVVKDLFLRVLQRQRSTEGVVDTLAALIDCLESAAFTRLVAPGRRVVRLPVWPDLEDRARIAIIPASDVMYAFTGGAVAQKFVGADWRRDGEWHEQRVYLRVNRFKDRDPSGIGVLATPYRTLADLCLHLDPGRFVHANQSTVINLDYLHYVDAVTPVELTIALPDRPRESVRVSRECWRAIRPLINFTARVQRRGTAAGVSR
jgi:hypothetical protein